MKRCKRVFLIVLDSLGAGALPDAEKFGDRGAHTLRSLSRSEKLFIPNLRRLGIGNIEGLGFLGTEASPLGAVCKLSERSNGKDSTIGHWEMAGVPVTYNWGYFKADYPSFPQELLDSIDPQTVEDMNLQVLPGSDGKEWE